MSNWPVGLELAQFISFWGIFRNPGNFRNDVTKAQERNILLHGKQPPLIKEKEKKKKKSTSLLPTTSPITNSILSKINPFGE